MRFLFFAVFSLWVIEQQKPFLTTFFALPLINQKIRLEDYLHLFLRSSRKKAIFLEEALLCLEINLGNVSELFFKKGKKRKKILGKLSGDKLFQKGVLYSRK